MRQADFFTVTIDDSSAVDKTEYMSVMIMFIEDGQHVPKFIALEKLHSATAAAITLDLVAVLRKVLCIDEVQLAGKLVWFSSDGVNTMMGRNSNVAVQLGTKYAPLMEPIHCCAHRLALVSSQLEQAPYFKQIGAVLKSVNTFYCNSPKRKEELRAFQEAVGCEKLNVLTVSDTRWISVYACMTQLVGIYPALAQMFYEESMFIYQSLTDVATVLSIKAFDFALYNLNVVIKLCQVRDVQYDQVAEAIEDLQTVIKRVYLNSATWFQHKIWTNFVDVGGEQSPLKWLEGKLGYGVVERLHYLYLADPKDALKQPSVTQQKWGETILKVSFAGRKGADSARSCCWQTSRSASLQNCACLHLLCCNLASGSGTGLWQMMRIAGLNS